MGAKNPYGFFSRACGFFFIVLNGIIFMIGVFLIEVRNDLNHHMDIAAHDRSLKVRHHALAITWFTTPQDSLTHFPWTAVLSSMIKFHCMFLMTASAMVVVCWPFTRSTYLFTTYYLLLSTAMIIRVFVISSCLEPSSRIFTTTVNSALTELKWKYQVLSNNSYVSAVNTYMIKGHCCGVNGPLDFSNIDLTIDEEDYLYPYKPEKTSIIYFPPGKVTYKFQVPPVCCKSYLFSIGGSKKSFDEVKDCALSSDIKLQNRKGCLEQIQDYVWERRHFIIILLTAMFMVEITALVIALILAFTDSSKSNFTEVVIKLQSEGKKKKKQV